MGADGRAKHIAVRRLALRLQIPGAVFGGARHRVHREPMGQQQLRLVFCRQGARQWRRRRIPAVITRGVHRDADVRVRGRAHKTAATGTVGIQTRALRDNANGKAVVTRMRCTPRERECATHVICVEY